LILGAVWLFLGACGPRVASLAWDDLPGSGLSAEVLELAQSAHRCAASQDLLGERRRDLLIVIDYSLPSTERRMWVLEPDRRRVLFHERVTHGKNTGEDLAARFSNVPDSKQSSLGAMRTAELYRGKHGLSLRLDGLEPGFNDRARERDIVIHPAWYNSQAFVDDNGRLGLSWGCPALDPENARRIIRAIRGGQLIVGYYPDPEWLDQSTLLRCDAAPVR